MREDEGDEAGAEQGLSLVPPGFGDMWGPSLCPAGGLSLHILCCRAGAEERVPAGIFVGSRLSIKWNTVFITSSILVQ